MQTENLHRFTKRARSYAFFRGLHRDNIDDFVQYAAIRFLKNNKVSVPFVYIDFLRGENGTTNQTRYGKKVVPMEKDLDIPSKKLSPEGMVALREAIELLRNQPRITAILVLVWGFSLKEVGFVFGVSETRAFQYFDEARNQLKKKIPIDSKQYLKIERKNSMGGY